MNNEYLDINRKSWNERVDTHLSSEFYDMPGFLAGKNSLNEIELELLGDVSGKSILHLQCHFGQDTLSLARMGAKATGVDLSDKAIEAAKKINQEMNLDAEFIASDIYSFPKVHNNKYDIIFTSYGAIGWLPDLDKWAKVITHFLKEKGKYIFAEFHPFVWMFDDNFNTIKYNYFNKETITEESNSYTDKESENISKFVSWNHPISDVLNSLIKNGLRIDSFNEFDYSPYNCLKGMKKVDDRKYILEKFEDKIPLVYSLSATKF